MYVRSNVIYAKRIRCSFKYSTFSDIIRGMRMFVAD